MNVFRMGWRNVWRNKRRSLVTIGAMTLALWVELLYAGMLPGFMISWEEDVTDLELGDVQIFAPDYQDRPSIFVSIADSDAVVARIEEAGFAASPRLLGGGLAASGDQSSGVALRGLDIARDASVSKISDHIAKGAWLDDSDPMGVVVGKRLARTLNAGVGSELVVLSQGADGSIANDLYTIRGVLGGIAEGTDRASVFMHDEAFRELMVLPTGAHEIVVRRGDVPLEAAAATIIGLAPGLDVTTWKQIMPILAQMLEATQGIVYIIFFILYVAVGILILNAMLMAVFERIREFGVLKAIGAGPSTVLGLILVETGTQALVAMVAGFVLAIPFMWYLSTYGMDLGSLGGADVMGVAMRQEIFGIYRPDVIMGPLVMLWFVVGMAAFYPALKAAFIDPIAAMRHR